MRLIRFENVAGSVVLIHPDAVRSIIQSQTEPGIAIIRTETDHVRVRMTPDEVLAALKASDSL